jgi:hypothetical protein
MSKLPAAVALAAADVVALRQVCVVAAVAVAALGA